VIPQGVVESFEEDEETDKTVEELGASLEVETPSEAKPGEEIQDLVEEGA